MGDDDTGETKLKLEALDEISDESGDKRIDHGGGFVIENGAGLSSKGTRDGDAPLLSGGEAGWQGVAQIGSIDEFEHAGDELLDLVFFEVACLAQREGDIFADGEGVKECAVLEDHGDIVANLLKSALVHSGHFPALHKNGAGVWFEETKENAQGDGFTDAAAAEDAEGLATRNVEADVVEDHMRTESDGDIAELDERLVAGSVGCREIVRDFGHISRVRDFARRAKK